MPDENKFQKLREVGYRIPRLCCYCQYGNFARGANWGTCAIHRYKHKKHDNAEGGRGVSIHIHGSCEKGFRVEYARLVLGAHMEFFDGRVKTPHGS